MPQEHYVLRCFSCETFQVHIVKKARKWECKMCGAKQSVKRNYGRGSGKQCRDQVMKLNELRLLNDSNSNAMEDGPVEEDLTVKEFKEQSEQNKPFTSKWVKYLDEHKSVSESDIDDSLVMEVEKKKKKRVKKMCIGVSSKNKRYCRTSDTSNASSPVTSNLSSPLSKQTNFRGCNTIEKTMENCCEAQNKLHFNKYAKYMDDDCDEDKKSNVMEDSKCSNVFDSGPINIDNILRLE